MILSPRLLNASPLKNEKTAWQDCAKVPENRNLGLGKMEFKSQKNALAVGRICGIQPYFDRNSDGWQKGAA